ncbi:sensor histidine kinase [Cyclobacterium salsum]|uniref:sensor histidine kinase n=1 Tax=Cyclobacterium salsum TaxID=2666329 RepID=UPI001391A3B2|nr:histidine kinase [Cyclobacterium salsum]
MKIKAPFDRYLLMLGLALLLANLRTEGHFWHQFIANILFTFVYWEGNYQLVGWVRERFPLMQQTRKRIVTQTGLSIGYTILGGTTVTLLLDLFGWAPYEWDYHLRVLLMGLFITAIIAIVYETIFYFDLWKSSLLESERLKKTAARLQFESLKNQVNPHFLFNSLNSLASLIPVDPVKAEKFVQEFARIYRYVLEVKDRNFVSLREEMDFVSSFVYLLKIRFGEHLKFEQQLEKHLDRYHIPPLILQNLVENAIKHNVILKDRPLVIRLEIQNDTLLVRNNLQKRSYPAASTQTGLRNMVQRLQLVANKDAKFYEKEGYFCAEIPLIPESD